MIPALAAPEMELAENPTTPPVWQAPTEPGPLFLAAEIDIYRPAAASVDIDDVALAAPALALAQDAEPAEVVETVRASDFGYRTHPSDPFPVTVFPPTLGDGFAIDVAVPLSPAQGSAGASWGTLRLANLDGRYTSLVTGGTTPNGRGVRVRVGRKLRDGGRGVWVDPRWRALDELWSGVGVDWVSGDGYLDVPLRDATYWLERQAQSSRYPGTGGDGGGPDLKGLAIPRARGGTADDPIRGVECVLIDEAHNIWQYTDAHGEVVALYEGGKAVFTPGADVSDLRSGSTSPGAYRTKNATGMFQLGSPAQGRITADVVGHFPAAGAVSDPARLMLRALAEDFGVPPEYIDWASFTGAAGEYPYVAGYWTGTADVEGTEILSMLAASMGAKLTPARNGQLRLMPMRWPPPPSEALYTADDIVALTPRALPDGMAPPPWRWRVGYQRLWGGAQRVDLDTGIEEERRKFLAEEWRTADWAEPALLNTYRRLADPPIVQTALLREEDAQAVADAAGAMWGARRRLYDMAVPIAKALRHQEGSGVTVAYPIEDMANGVPALVVGQSIRMGEAVATLRVLC